MGRWSGRGAPVPTDGAMDVRQLDQRSVGLRLLAQLGPGVRRGPPAAGRWLRGLLPLPPWRDLSGARLDDARRRYWSLAAGLHQRFAYVLTYLYNPQHANHVHVDNGRSGNAESTLSSQSQVQVQAVQAICTYLWDTPVEFTGRVGLGHPNRGRPGAGPARAGRRDGRAGSWSGFLAASAARGRDRADAGAQLELQVPAAEMGPAGRSTRGRTRSVMPNSYRAITRASNSTGIDPRRSSAYSCTSSPSSGPGLQVVQGQREMSVHRLIRARLCGQRARRGRADGSGRTAASTAAARSINGAFGVSSGGGRRR